MIPAARIVFAAVLSLTFTAPYLSAQTSQPEVRKLSRSERKERIKALSDKYRQFLAEVEPIMRPEELDTFLQLESDAQRDLYIDDFWRRRATALGISVVEVREQYYARLQTAKEKYRSVSSDRGRVYVIHGLPDDVKTYGGLGGCHLIQPLEIWTYGNLPGLGRNVRLVFFVPRNSIDYRLWQPRGGATEALSEIISLEVIASVLDNEAAAMQLVFGGDTQCGVRKTHLECECRDGEEIMKAISGSQMSQGNWNHVFDPPEVNPEDVRRILQSVVLANPAAAPLPVSFSVAFPARRGSQTDAQMTITIPRAKLVMKEVGGVKQYGVDVIGEVLKEDQLFERYRYRFDYPFDTVGDQVAVVVDRFLKPAEYRSRIKVSDINSNTEAVVDKVIVVPELASAQNGGATSTDDVESAATRLRILPLSAELLHGPQHIDTIVSGEEIKAVDFYLDGTKIMTKRVPPFALDLDLGEIPQLHRVRAIGVGAKGEFVAGDELVVNSGGGDFRIRIVSPRVAPKLSGKTRVQMTVDVPEGKKLANVELYLNDQRVATLYGPPYVQVVDLPSRLVYLRAVATLADSEQPPVEDAVVINAPGAMEVVNVHLVELPTTVTRDGHPVSDLQQSAFTVLDDGKPVTISKFEHVTNLPLSLGIAIDTSTSMRPRMTEAQKAAAEFLSQVMKKGDQAFLVAFDAQPHVIQSWSSNIADIASALARLRTDESTALYDAVVYSLYNFVGTKGQKALVVITDGRDTASKFSFDQAVEYARRAAVPVYTIGVGIGAADIDARYRLGKFAAETGGDAYFIDHIADLHQIYDRIQTELRSQYILGFYPADAANARSKWHPVTVQAAGGKAKTIRGYYP